MWMLILRLWEFSSTKKREINVINRELCRNLCQLIAQFMHFKWTYISQAHTLMWGASSMRNASVVPFPILRGVADYDTRARLIMRRELCGWVVWQTRDKEMRESWMQLNVQEQSLCLQYPLPQMNLPYYYYLCTIKKRIEWVFRGVHLKDQHCRIRNIMECLYWWCHRIDCYVTNCHSFT